ncbi:MAG: hypothetical protein OEM15_14545 [Myxococcales bacterium]|nr:hypothetical protein [Myxococcales bacterium]MDH3483236.1 hypothetical protein [Myxococcales bacterium]
MDDHPEDARLAHRVHEALEPLREQVVRVSRDFTRRVSEGIEELLQGGRQGPSLLALLGSTLLEAVNLVTRATNRGNGSEGRR